MEKQVIFRDYQEQAAQDHNDIQTFTRQSIDHLRHDVITATRRFAGFSTVKTAQTEIQVGIGRFYDVLGVVYARDSVLTQSMLTYLPALAKRIILLTVYGSETETDVEERDFLQDVDTGRSEPQAVATVRSRDAILTLLPGIESADPVAPTVPVGSVAIASILLDNISVVSITMLTENMVTSTENLDLRTDDLEEFESSVGPRLSSLASDLAALDIEIRKRAFTTDLANVYIDLARLKEFVSIPVEASDYGADHFISDDDTDALNALTLGHDAWTFEGIRFPFANEDENEIAVFSSNDPNAMVTSGLLLPAYDTVLKMAIYPWETDIGMAQYGFQTYDLTQQSMSLHREQYGNQFTVCTNSAFIQGGWFALGAYGWDPLTHLFWVGGAQFYTPDNPDIFGGNAHVIRVQSYWREDWNAAYWIYVKTDHSIEGAQVAQSFLNANDMWLTRLRFVFTAKGGNENVWVTLCEVTNGVPDLDKTILHQSIDHTTILVGDWTAINVVPTFLERGKRYAVVLTSAANHKIAMAGGQHYLDGTFFYSTDGAWYQGDLTKDIVMEFWDTKFRAPQTVIELDALNLDGGLLNLDILSQAVTPGSSQIIYEAQPGGSGAWIQLVGGTDAFAGAPPLVRFRVRFVGTTDVQGGIMLPGSRVHMSRPKVDFKHVSKLQTLASASATVHVRLRLEAFNDTPHDVLCKLAYGTPKVEHPATAITTTTINATQDHYYREYAFTGISPTITQFAVVVTGHTNSASNTFHVAERVYWSL